MAVKKGDKRGHYKRRVREKRYVCSCSFGKDSLATLLLALENGEPLDCVIYVEVMYDLSRGISGENPLHVRWVYDVAIPKLREMGVDVIVLRSAVDYAVSFNKLVSSGRNSGKRRGFPLANMCHIQRECKLNPIRDYIRSTYLNAGYDVVEYIGIAIDEVERLESLNVKSFSVRVTKSSLLAKYRYTETMALLKCHEYGLLSPIYFDVSSRNGCWFCPNQDLRSFCRLRRDHNDLWRDLYAYKDADNLVSDRFKYDLSLVDLCKRMDDYEEKYQEYL